MLVSAALFYWIGLVLEAFSLTIHWSTLCRFITLCWFASGTLVMGLPFWSRSLPADSKWVANGVLGFLYLTIAFDLCLVIVGLSNTSTWLAVPLVHAGACYRLLRLEALELRRSFRA